MQSALVYIFWVLFARIGNLSRAFLQEPIAYGGVSQRLRRIAICRIIGGIPGRGPGVGAEEGTVVQRMRRGSQPLCPRAGLDSVTTGTYNLGGLRHANADLGTLVLDLRLNFLQVLPIHLPLIFVENHSDRCGEVALYKGRDPVG
jgi:hypothetical protein